MSQPLASMIALLLAASLACGRDAKKPPPDQPDDDAAASVGGRTGDATFGGGGRGGLGGSVTVDASTGGGAAGRDSGDSDTAAGSDGASDRASTSSDGGRDGGSGTPTLASLYCPSTPPTGDPVPANARAMKIDFKPALATEFTEGPVWVAEQGVLLFSDFKSGGRIIKFTPPRMAEVFIAGTGTNGLAIAPDGKSILGAAGGVVRFALADKMRTVIATMYQNGTIGGANDLTVRGDGLVWLTDLIVGRLYRITPAGQVTLVDSIARANGVALSPDEKSLYVNSGNRIVRLAINADGTNGQVATFAMGLQNGDGITVDCAGNVYSAEFDGGRVSVFSPMGRPLGQITVAGQTTNLAFGGLDRKTLYITSGSNGFYSITLAIPGLPF